MVDESIVMKYSHMWENPDRWALLRFKDDNSQICYFILDTVTDMLHIIELDDLAETVEQKMIAAGCRIIDDKLTMNETPPDLA